MLNSKNLEIGKELLELALNDYPDVIVSENIYQTFLDSVCQKLQLNSLAELSTVNLILAIQKYSLVDSWLVESLYSLKEITELTGFDNFEEILSYVKL